MDTLPRGPELTQFESWIHCRDGRVDSASDCKVVIASIFFFVVSVAISMIVYRFRYFDPTQSKESQVYQRGPVAVDAKYQDILTEHSKVLENVLGYITLWNSNGYELAIKFNSKFNTFVVSMV